MKVKNILVLVLVFSLFVAIPAFSKAGVGKKVVMKSLEFPGNYMEDGCWDSIGIGLDGKVYMGLCTEGGGHAHFYIYDPDTGKIKHRADMVEFLDGGPTGTRTHGKIHTAFLTDNEGNIYFATGNMGAGPIDVDPRTWEGGHWIKYDPKTDTLHDLGLVALGVGIYGFAIDKERNLLFGAGYNGHFYVHNIETGQTFDKGRVNIQGSGVARSIVCDDEGNVFGTYIIDRMFKYDAKQERVFDLSIRLLSDPTTYPVTGSIYNKLMRVGVWDDVNKKMYGVEGATSILFEYDPKVGKEGSIRALERLMPYQHSEEAKKYHYATLGFTIGLDRKVYYMPFGTLGQNERNKGADPIQWVGQGYLMTYDLKTGKKENLGPVFTDKGERVVDFLCRAPSGAATTGKDGTLYFMAWVEEKDPKKVSFVYNTTPASLRLLIYKPK